MIFLIISDADEYTVSFRSNNQTSRITKLTKHLVSYFATMEEPFENRRLGLG